MSSAGNIVDNQNNLLTIYSRLLIFRVCVCSCLCPCACVYARICSLPFLGKIFARKHEYILSNVETKYDNVIFRYFHTIGKTSITVSIVIVTLCSRVKIAEWSEIFDHKDTKNINLGRKRFLSRRTGYVAHSSQ